MLRFVAAVLALALTGAAPAAASTTVVPAARFSPVLGQSLEGRLVLRTPAVWSRVKTVPPAAASFTTSPSEGCSASIGVRVAAEATTASAAQQLKRYDHPGDVAIASGRRPGGRWRVIASAAPPEASDSTIDLSGRMVDRVATRRWLHVSIRVQLRSCQRRATLHGAIASEVANVLSTARDTIAIKPGTVDPRRRLVGRSWGRASRAGRLARV